MRSCFVSEWSINLDCWKTEVLCPLREWFRWYYCYYSTGSSSPLISYWCNVARLSHGYIMKSMNKYWLTQCTHNGLVFSDLGRTEQMTNISAPNVSIRELVTRYISAKRVWEPVTQRYISAKCFSESWSHDTSVSSVVWLWSSRGDISASNVRIRKFVTQLFQRHTTIISNRGYTISLLRYRRISFLQKQRHYILID